MNNQSGTVKMYSEKMCKSQTVQVKAPETRIGGSVKFYDKQKDFGFISADHGQDYYFRMSDFSQSVNGGLAPHTKVTFIPKSNRKKDKCSFATEIQLVNSQVNRVTSSKSSFRSDESLPPPCPHCGARKGSHFGWVGGYGNKIYLCKILKPKGGRKLIFMRFLYIWACFLLYFSQFFGKYVDVSKFESYQ